MGVINSMPRAERVNLDASTQEINRAKSSSDEKISSIAKDRISTLGRIFRVSLRLSLVVILVPAFLLKLIYDVALFLIKGKKPEEQIDENSNLSPESKREETEELRQDLPIETPEPPLVKKYPEDDNSKDLVADESAKTEENSSPVPISKSCCNEKQKQLEDLLNPFIDKKEIKEETEASNQSFFSFSAILGYFKPLFSSTNKTSSEKEQEELSDKLDQVEVDESPNLQKRKVQEKRVRFADEDQEASIPLKSKILHSSIPDDSNVSVVEKKEREVPKKSAAEQTQPLRRSSRLREIQQAKADSAPTTSTKKAPANKSTTKEPEPEQTQPLRRSSRLREIEEAKAASAAPSSIKRAATNESKTKEPEATPSVRRSARIEALKKKS